jgi:hypothetical protein
MAPKTDIINFRTFEFTKSRKCVHIVGFRCEFLKHLLSLRSFASELVTQLAQAGKRAAFGMNSALFVT